VILWPRLSQSGDEKRQKIVPYSDSWIPNHVFYKITTLLSSSTWTIHEYVKTTRRRIPRKRIFTEGGSETPEKTNLTETELERP
jgi:hypothetical protein